MKKQRICIVGDGLSGLVSAIALNKLPNVEIHLIAKKAIKNRDKRTTAISESNLKFLQENIVNLNTKLFWPSKKIELFYETKKEKINFLNLMEKNKNLMHVFENEKFKNILLQKVKKNKIKIIRKEIKNLKLTKDYDLSILCLGGKAKIYKKLITSRAIRKDYKEIAITGCINHKIKNLATSQFFLKEGPLAILPFAKNKFSFVWSLSKLLYEKNINNIDHFVKDKIKNILKIKYDIQVLNLQPYPIHLNLERKYHDKNVLILGEGLHTIHPVAGQGFNLVLRDIKKFKEILEYYLTLGISINNSYALKDFNVQRKPENIIFGLGIDMTHNFFKQNKYLDPLKEIILKNISENNMIKKISKIISNQGLSI